MDLFDVRCFVHTLPQKAAMWLAWRMPRWLVYWCSLRAAAHATSGDHGTDHPDDVSVMDMLKRWE